MADTLSTTTSTTGQQTSTQTPQNSVAAGTGTSSTTRAQAGAIQPGTAVNLLNSQTGISLHDTSLPTINLNATTASQQSSPVQTTGRHLHPTLFVVSFMLLAVAVYLFWSTGRSVNSTTK